MDRVFLDANVLFSAAYRSDSPLANLWKLKKITLVSSAYAIQEANINLETNEQRKRLDRLIKSLEILNEIPDVKLPDGIALPDKDRPILQAALATNCTHLLAGDLRHFGAYFGQSVGKILNLRPGEYPGMKSDQLEE